MRYCSKHIEQIVKYNKKYLATYISVDPYRPKASHLIFQLARRQHLLFDQLTTFWHDLLIPLARHPLLQPETKPIPNCNTQHPPLQCPVWSHLSFEVATPSSQLVVRGKKDLFCDFGLTARRYTSTTLPLESVNAFAPRMKLPLLKKRSQ